MKNIAKCRRAMLTPKPVEGDTVQTDRWNDEAKETESDEGGTLTLTTTRSTSLALAQARVKAKGECWTCGAVAHQAAE